MRWKQEGEKKPASITATDALKILGLGPQNLEAEEGVIRKAYFKMAQQYHPDKNPKGREMFEKVNTAYEFLCSRSAKSSDAPDANNIVLVLRTQSILFCRYSEELHPYFDFCLLYRLDALEERRSFYLVDPGSVRDASGCCQSISLPYQVVIAKQLATGQLYELERTMHLCLCQ